MTNDDYWGATGADLPRVARSGATAVSVMPADLDATAPLAAVDVPPPPASDPSWSAGPGLPESSAVQSLDEDPEPLFRTEDRVPGSPSTPAGSAPAGGSSAAPPSGATAVRSEDPADSQRRATLRRVTPALMLALAAVAGIALWRLLLPNPGLTAVPQQTTPIVTPAPSLATPVTAAPRPTVRTLAPLPLPPIIPAPAHTITQTMLVTIPAPVASPTPTPSASPSASTSASPTGSPTNSASATPTPTLPPIPTDGWQLTQTGVGPITIGMPVAQAAQEGYLVPSPQSPGGFVTSPALLGIDLSLADGVIAGIVITEPDLTTPEGVGVGTPLERVLEAYGPDIVSIIVLDAAGTARAVPGLDYPATYIAFIPSTQTGPSPTATPTVGASSATPGPTDTATATATPSSSASPEATPTAPLTVEAIIIGAKAETPSAQPSGPDSASASASVGG